MFICTPALFTYVLIFVCNRFIIVKVCFDSCCLYQRDHNRRLLMQYFVSSQHSLEMFIVSLRLCVCRRISEIWKANTSDKSNFQLFFHSSLAMKVNILNIVFGPPRWECFSHTIVPGCILCEYTPGTGHYKANRRLGANPTFSNWFY